MRILFVFPFLLFLLLMGCVSPALPSSQSNGSISRVCFENDSCVGVEVADTPELRAQGLMFRESLAADAGMLFAFEDSSIHGFWMKNTKIPLDMIWIDESFRVVDVQSAVPCLRDPCLVYVPMEDSRYVVELSAGQAQVRGIVKGTRVTFESEPA